MPLKKGKSKAVKAANMRELKAAGYPLKQRVAIMLSEAGESNKKKKKKK